LATKKINLSKDLFDFKYTVAILKMVWACSKKLTIARLLLQVLLAILPLAPLYLMKLLLDAFTLDIKPSFEYVIWILMGFAVIKVLTIVVKNAMNYVYLIQSEVVADLMASIVLNKAINIDVEYFDSDAYHDVFSRAIAQSGSRPIATLSAVTGLLQNGISLLAIAALLITLHWAISLILIFIAIPIALIRWHYTNKTVELKVKQTQEERKAYYFHSILSSVEYLKEVRIFNYGKVLLQRFLNLRIQLREARKKLYRNQNFTIALVQGVEALAIISALGFIATQAIRGNISVGDIAMYYGAFQKGQSSINSVLRSLVSINENRMYLNHLFEFLELKQKIIDPENPVTIPAKIESLQFKKVSFTYPETEKQILNSVNFEATKGTILAIVGENGAGKSTIVKLINRFYEPGHGSICFNGIDIKNFKIDDWRSRLTVIFQQFSKYNATVNENIQFADVHAPFDVEKIKQSAGLSQANTFIEKLPDHYETALGRNFKTGHELSGGQWQKMALARAFYKNADIIILDEPTSFIDPLAEEDIFNNLKQLAKDKILILITHRIYNLKMADHILVMENGNIIETGNHESLIAQNGRYKAMFLAQE